MEQEEEEESDGVIYADPGRRSRLSTRGGYLRGMQLAHQVGLLSGDYNLGCNLRGVISGIRIKPILHANGFLGQPLTICHL